jgi:hypothetical protein
MTTTDDALLALLEESDLPTDDDLVGLLADLRSLGTGPVPAVGPELAALLVTDGARRRRLHRRGAVVGALVVLSLGTGVTAAAASPGVRDGAAGAVAAVVHVLRPPVEAPSPRRTPVPVVTPAGGRLIVAPGPLTPRPSASARAVLPAVPAVRSSNGAGDGSRTGSDSAGSGDAHGRGSSDSGKGPGPAGSGTSGSGTSGSGTGSPSGSSGHGSGSGNGSGDGSGDSQGSGAPGSGRHGGDSVGSGGSDGASGIGSRGGSGGWDD